MIAQVPADPVRVTSTSFQPPVVQLSSDRPVHTGKLYPLMDYLITLADTQQLAQRSNIDCCQGDLSGHGQHFSGTYLDAIPAMPWRLVSSHCAMPISGNTVSAYTEPHLMPPANQRASDARRRRAAKFTCAMCGSSLTTELNLISKLFFPNGD